MNTEVHGHLQRVGQPGQFGSKHQFPLQTDNSTKRNCGPVCIYVAICNINNDTLWNILINGDNGIISHTIQYTGHSIPNQQKKSRPLLIFMKFGTDV